MGGEGRGERGESPLISHTESCLSFLTNEKSTYLLSCYEVAMRINYNSVYVKFRTEFLKNSIQVEFLKLDLKSIKIEICQKSILSPC